MGGFAGIIFSWLKGKYYRFLNMDGEVIQLGESIRVTLTSHEVAQLAEISERIHFMLYSDLRTRWTTFLFWWIEDIYLKDMYKSVVARIIMRVVIMMFMI